MDLEAVKTYLEKGGEAKEAVVDNNKTTIHGMPLRFFEHLIMHGITLDFIERGHIICSMKVPPRLLTGSNILHGGAAAMLVDVLGSGVIYTYGVVRSGISVEINVSYIDVAYENEEIEIEANALHVGKVVAVVSVELRKKKTGKIIVQGRHTKYLAITSRL